MTFTVKQLQETEVCQLAANANLQREESCSGFILVHCCASELKDQLGTVWGQVLNRLCVLCINLCEVFYVGLGPDRWFHFGSCS